MGEPSSRSMGRWYEGRGHAHLGVSYRNHDRGAAMKQLMEGVTHMFERISDGTKRCSDCGKRIRLGAAVIEDDDGDYRRCQSCQFHANHNPLNQSASINPFNY